MKTIVFFVVSLMIFSVLFVPICSYEQVQSNSQTKITLKVSYANDTAQSYTVTLNPQEKYILPQSYSWVRDQNSRFNLQDYSIDNTPYQTIQRVDRGNFTLDIPTDSSHSVVFLAVPQYPIELNGTNSAVFSPPSPTGDNWFDMNSDIVVSVPYVTNLDQNSRTQLTGWSLDGSSSQPIPRQEDGTFSTPTISMSSPHTAYFGYVTQYYVNILSEFGHVTGGGWHDSGTTVTISVVPSQDFPVGHVFSGWQGANGSNANSINLLVDSPKTLTANWKSDYGPVIAVGTIIIGCAAGLAVIYKKRKSSPLVQPKVIPPQEQTRLVQEQMVPSSQVDSTYSKELADYILQKSLERLDMFQAAGVLSPQRHDKLKEELTDDESGR